MKKTIIFDWDGTIAHRELASRAALEEMKYFGMDISMEELHEYQKTHAHYDDTRNALKKIVGDLDKDILTAMMTNMFQYYYLKAANEKPDEIYYEEMLDILKMLKKKYKLVIASNLRTDILKPLTDKHALGIFDEIFANTPDLKYDKEYLVKKACEKHDCIFMIGDREEDINAGKKHNLKTIMVDWGYAINKKQNGADYFITKPEEMLEIIK